MTAIGRKPPATRRELNLRLLAQRGRSIGTAMRNLEIPDIRPFTLDQDIRLLEAARSGDERRVIALLDEGLDVNVRDKNGHTALMFAAMSGSLHTVMTLRKRGANTAVKDSLGWNAYNTAMFYGDFRGVTMPPYDKIVAYLEKFERR